MMRTQVIFAPRAANAPPRFVVVDAAGAVLQRGELTLAEAPAADLPTVLIVPGQEVVAWRLDLPARSEAQARAAAAALLQDRLATAAEPPHLAVGPGGPGDQRLVAAVAPARLQSWLDAARLYGVRPDVVLPDHLALPAPIDGELTAVVLDGDVAVRGHDLAFTCEHDLVNVLLGDRPSPEPLAGEAAERALATGAIRPALNLLQGPFDPRRAQRPAGRELRRVAVLCAFLALSPLLVMGTKAIRYEFAADALERRTAERVAAVLPQGASLTDPEAQVGAHLARLEAMAGGGPGPLAASLFAALERIDQAQLETLMFSPDGAMRASVSFAAPSDAELLRRAMRQAGLAYREEGAREEGGRMIVDAILGAR